MYFKKYNTLYLHPGKTAGTSIENAILPEERDASISDREKLFGWDKEYKCYLQHATAQSALKYLGSEQFGQAFIFTSVRNPYARIISVYNYGIKGFEQRYGGFRSFVLQLPNLVQKQNASIGNHISPQYLFATIQDKPVCDIVIRFESLNEGFSQITHLQKTKWTLQQPHYNPYKSKSTTKVSDYYDTEMVEAMQIAYADDFHFFDYPNIPLGLVTKKLNFTL